MKIEAVGEGGKLAVYAGLSSVCDHQALSQVAVVCNISTASPSLHLLASPSRLVSTPPACTPGKPLCMHAAHSEREGGGEQGGRDVDRHQPRH